MKKITLQALLSLKKSRTPVAMITAYDFPSAVFADRAQIDVILVGDSGGMTVLGRPSTLSVTMDEMIQFAKAVGAAKTRAFVIGDMPFLSYQASNGEAVRNAGRFLAEAGCDAVKIEGGERMAKRINAIREAGIPVMAHLGLNPQSITLQSGYRVQGRTQSETQGLIADALAVEKAGASFILLEALPERAAQQIHRAVKIPVYGIGAGRKLDGQLLILHDVLGMFVGEIQPRFAKKYLNGGELITRALKNYVDEVRSQEFPAEEHLYSATSVPKGKVLPWTSSSEIEKH